MDKNQTQAGGCRSGGLRGQKKPETSCLRTCSLPIQGAKDDNGLGAHALNPPLSEACVRARQASITNMYSVRDTQTQREMEPSTPLSQCPQLIASPEVEVVLRTPPKLRAERAEIISGRHEHDSHSVAERDLPPSVFIVLVGARGGFSRPLRGCRADKPLPETPRSTKCAPRLLARRHIYALLLVVSCLL